MSFILILKELWSRRILVGASIVVAAALSILVVYQVSVSPPSISKRNHVDAQGSIEILIDSARSPIADARRDLLGLSARAGVFARLMSGGNVVGEIADKNGIPVKQIDVAGPTPLPGEAPGAGEASPELHPYGIAFTQLPELPIVNVVTRAPTVAEARALAAAAPAAIRDMVESIQEEQGTPTRERVEFRVLGPAQATLIDDASGKKVALGLFVALVAIFIGLILGVPRLVAAWRTVDSEAQPWDPRDEQGQAPEVLHLPAGRGGELENDDPGAALIGQPRES